MDISTNRISLTFDDTERMEKKNVSVQDAKDGGISQIQVGATMDCSVQEAGKHHIVYTEAEAKQLQKQNMVPLDDAQMAPADFISRCMTGKDAKAVSEDGTPLEEYTSSQLERAVTRIKKERHEKQEAVEREVSKQREKDEAVSKNAAQLAVDGNVPDAVIDRLLDSDLPVTEENVAKLSHAVDMASEIRSFSDAAMKFFIDNENTILTPESINAGVHGAVEGEENPSSEENDFSLVENQVRSRLEESGMEADDENMAAAKWLYEEDLPVTAENVALSSQVKELKETKDSVLAARIADQMAEGVQPEKANLVKLSVAEAVRFKRRLAETQLTMTADAIRTMSEKGISIDVTKLEDVVEKLRAAEKEAYQSELFNADLPVTEENINTLKETSQAVKQVLSAPVEFMGYAFTQGVEDTLSSLSSKAEAFTASFDMVENRYESVGTEVRRDLGDSLTKAFSNIDTLLEEAGFETTARNERAVRALAYNQMPLTEENLVSVKEYDERVTTLMKNMKPEVVCELIRKGENPLEKTLDELQNDVNEILAQNDIEDISFRKYLWKMDHTDGLTEDERETMIGVYRLLHQIEKSDGAAAAQVLNEGKELSLSSLLSAVRTRKKAGMDVSVDDSFGMEKEVIASKNSISEQIYAAYGQNIAADLMGKLSPQVLKEAMDGNEEIESLQERITGRYLCENIVDKDGNVLVKANHMVTPKRAELIMKKGVDENGETLTKIKIRTILTCRSHSGICAKCYGANMATGEPVQVGEAVGIIAAQSIGEPGTQLTMRTFHTGGVAGDDITQGLPRVEELFEARKPKGLAIITEFAGTATINDTKKKREIIVTNDETGESKAYLIPYGSRIKIQDGVKLNAGDELTEGSVNPHDILKIKGLRAVQDYMLQEVQRVYRLQGVEINDKHIEVIVRQMLKKIRIEEAGDTEFLPGTNVDILEFEDVNKALEEEGKEPATGEQIMLGITKASLATNSFLSAASFQETTKVLTEAAIKGKIDPLVGLKENVIIGKHIPAGTGMNKYRDIHLDSNAVKVEESEASDEMEEETVKQAGTLELVDEIETEEVLVEE